MNDTKFKAQIYPLRVFSGPSSLSNLPKEVTRLGVGRVLVISGRTVSRATALVNYIESLLGERFAARFDEVDRHCLEPCMTRALEMAQALQVDAIVSVGAGTACMAARILAIALAEEEPFERLSTHYEPGKVPVSPRLYKPKVPIWNVLTTATSAQNGAGATMKTYPQAERWEFFDPKTRAMGVFWDANALASTSESVSRAAGLSTLWFSLMRMGGVGHANPLVQGDRHQAWRLALASMDHLGLPVDANARINMCAASYLHNRDVDHGGRPFELHWVVRVCYALGAGLMSINDDIGPGQAYLSLTCAAIRVFGERDLSALKEMCSFLPKVQHHSLKDWGVEEIANAVEGFFASKGFRCDLKTLGLKADQLPRVREMALRNFNADPKGEFIKEVDLLDNVLSLSFEKNTAFNNTQQ